MERSLDYAEMINELHHKKWGNLDERTNSKVQEDSQFNQTELRKGDIGSSTQVLVL